MTNQLTANQKIIPFSGAFRAVIGNHFLNTVFHEEGPPCIWSVYADRLTGSSLISVPVFEQAPHPFHFLRHENPSVRITVAFLFSSACFFCGLWGICPVLHRTILL